MRFGWATGAAAAGVVGAVAAGAVFLQPKASPTVEQIAQDFARQRAGPVAALIGSELLGRGISTGGFSFSESGEATNTATEDVPAEGGQQAGTRTTETRNKISVSGQIANLEREVRISEMRGPDRVNFRALATATVTLCPDAKGEVDADVSLHVSGDLAQDSSVGTGGVSRNIGGKAKVTGQVSDDAVLTTMRLEITGDQSERGGAIISANGQKAGVRSATSGGFTTRSSVSLKTETLQSGAESLSEVDTNRSITRRGEDRSELAGHIAYAFSQNIEELSRAAMQAAQSKWRDGYCTEVLVKPPNKGGGENNAVTPGEVRPISASVRHKFEGVEISTRMTAALEGQKAISPSSVDKTPGVFAYTADEESGIHGDVTLTSLSRRGRAKEIVAFSTGCYRMKLSVGPYFVIDEKVCDIESPFSVRPQGAFGGVTVTFTPQDRNGGAFSQSGTAYGVQWSGGGPYTITWENGIGRFRGVDNNTATAPFAQSHNNDIMTGALTPETK